MSFKFQNFNLLLCVITCLSVELVVNTAASWSQKPLKFFKFKVLSDHPSIFLTKNVRYMLTRRSERLIPITLWGPNINSMKTWPWAQAWLVNWPRNTMSREAEEGQEFLMPFLPVAVSCLQTGCICIIPLLSSSQRPLAGVTLDAAGQT